MRIYDTIKPYFNVFRFSVKSIQIRHPVRTCAAHRFDELCRLLKALIVLSSSFYSDCTYKGFEIKKQDQEEFSKSLDMKASSRCRDTRKRCLRQKELARQGEESVEAKEPASAEELESTLE